MNTKQLIVIWYAALAASCLLVAHAVQHRPAMLWPVLVAIVVLAVLAVYSFRPHPAARKGLVALVVLVPLLLLLVGSGYLIYISRFPPLPAEDPFVHMELFEADDYQLFDVGLEFDVLGRGELTGRVHSRSSIETRTLRLRIQLFAGGVQIDGTDVRLEFDPGIPPGEARSFKTGVSGLRPKGHWTARYTVLGW